MKYISEFKIGDLIQATDVCAMAEGEENEGTECLTIGKIYQLFAVGNTHVWIYNDLGERHSFGYNDLKEMFTLPVKQYVIQRRHFTTVFPTLQKFIECTVFLDGQELYKTKSATGDAVGRASNFIARREQKSFSILFN